MLDSSRLGLDRLWSTFKARVQKLPILAGKARAPGFLTPALRPWLLIALGLGLGFLGYNLTARESRESWLYQNPPPKTLWEQILRARGFVPASDETLIRVRSELPFIREGAPRVHILESRRAVLIVAGQELLLYGLGAGSLPAFRQEDWEALGFGWDALGRLLEINFPVFSSTQTLRRARPHPNRDPREIHY